MTYLAGVLSKHLNFIPSTDDIKNFDIIKKSSSALTEKLKLKEKLLNDLLPYPINAEPSDIRKFKEKYSDQLWAFRNKVEQLQIEIMNIQDENDREEYYNLKISEIIYEKEHVHELLKKTAIGKTQFGKLVSVGGPIISTLNNPLKIFDVFKAVTSNFIDESINVISSYTYLALLDNKFVKSKSS